MPASPTRTWAVSTSQVIRNLPVDQAVRAGVHAISHREWSTGSTATFHKIWKSVRHTLPSIAEAVRIGWSSSQGGLTTGGGQH
jgi:hypothetical protein